MAPMLTDWGVQGLNVLGSALQIRGFIVECSVPSCALVYLGRSTQSGSSYPDRLEKVSILMI